MKNKTEEVNKKKDNFDDLLNKLHVEETNIKKKEDNKRTQFEVKSMYNYQDDLTSETPLDEKKTEFSKHITPKVDKIEIDDKIDKLKVKQRLVKFSFKLFEKFDLTKVLEFWISKFFFNLANAKFLYEQKNSILKNREVKNTGDDEKKIAKEKLDKNKEKTDANIKYEFKQPEKSIRKIIPHCNNLFYIVKNDN